MNGGWCFCAGVCVCVCVCVCGDGRGVVGVGGGDKKKKKKSSSNFILYRSGCDSNDTNCGWGGGGLAVYSRASAGRHAEGLRFKSVSSQTSLLCGFWIS